jgi:hypothetical protein
MGAKEVDERLRRVLKLLEGDEAAIELVSRLIDELDDRRPKAWGTGMRKRRSTSGT